MALTGSFDPTKIVVNQQKALIKLCHSLHELSANESAIPVDTGYLRDESVEFRTQGTKVVIAYKTDYAQYVWYSNKTGIPQWTLKVFERHRTELLKELFNDLIKGVE